MDRKPTLDDLIGIEYAKLGFFKELQEKVGELETSNRKLEANQRHIQGILNGITDVMVILSLDRRISSVNRVFFEVFENENPIGLPCHQVFRRLEKPCDPCPVETACASNTVCRQLHIFPVRGQNRHFEITASPLRDSHGQPFNILLLKRDVTLEKEYQAKYYLAEKMATIGSLAAGVAHEINNPMTAILGFAEALKRRLPKLQTKLPREQWEDFNEYLEIVLSECQRCRSIVQNLLDFGRQKSDVFLQVDLNAIVADTLKLLQNHLKGYPSGHVGLELSLEPSLVYGVSSQLKQILLNLLSNALDATEEKGSIKIRTFKCNDGWVGLTVEDTGCGIPAEHLDKLFEPFFTTKAAGRGIGIGLSTCYNIIQSHKGEILVCSEQGEGSTFLVKLPFVDQEKKSPGRGPLLPHETVIS